MLGFELRVLPIDRFLAALEVLFEPRLVAFGDGVAHEFR